MGPDEIAIEKYRVGLCLCPDGAVRFSQVEPTEGEVPENFVGAVDLNNQGAQSGPLGADLSARPPIHYYFPLSPAQGLDL